MARKVLQQLTPAPVFALKDTQGNIVSLESFRGKPVVLVLTRGFV